MVISERLFTGWLILALLWSGCVGLSYVMLELQKRHCDDWISVDNVQVLSVAECGWQCDLNPECLGFVFESDQCHMKTSRKLCSDHKFPYCAVKRETTCGFLRRGEKCTIDMTTAKYALTMEEVVGDKVMGTTENATIREKTPSLVDGKLGKFLRTDGQRFYLSFGSKPDECFGDNRKCAKGFTMSMLLKIDNLFDGLKYIFSSGGQTERAHCGVAVYYDGNLVNVMVRYDPNVEKLAAPVQPGEWFFLVTTWSEADGLKLYVNDQLHGSPSKNLYTFVFDGDVTQILIGAGNWYYNGRLGGLHGAFDMDDFMFYDEIKPRAFLSDLYQGYHLRLERED